MMPSNTQPGIRTMLLGLQLTILGGFVYVTRVLDFLSVPLAFLLLVFGTFLSVAGFSAGRGPE